jgi:hypothetical protein
VSTLNIDLPEVGSYWRWSNDDSVWCIHLAIPGNVDGKVEGVCIEDPLGVYTNSRDTTVLLMWPSSRWTRVDDFDYWVREVRAAHDAHR